MDKKKFIICIIIILFIVFVLFITSNKIVKNDNKHQNIVKKNEVRIEKDNESGNIVVYSSNNEVIVDGIDESMIKFYQDNPDFEP